MTNLVDKARQFAIDAHRSVGQLRKYTGQPYEEHLRAVAEMVGTVTDDPEVIAAAWLHDVVEDTPTTIEEIEREFGPDVRELVDALTDISRPHDGNRAARKARDREHLAKAPARAQTVKLADLIDNCQDICRHNARFCRVYLAEMAALLDALTRGDAVLQRKARKSFEKWSARLAKMEVPSPTEVDSALIGLPKTQMQRTLYFFAHRICAGDVAEPLPRFDAYSSTELARDAAQCPVYGVRLGGHVTAYALPGELGTGRFADVMRPLAKAQLLGAEAGLADVVAVLTRHDYCFVTVHGEVAAYIGRDEMQGPMARMWLFGLITTLELAMTERIRSARSGLDVAKELTAARLEKARALQHSREALGRPVSLLDCLQLSDKIRLMLAIDDGQRPLLRGQSKAESQRLARDLENLRNSLAHAQEIVTQDWAQIARLAKRLEELATDHRDDPRV